MLNYLIMEDFSGQQVPILFPPKVAHADMRDQLPYGAILSGGTVRLTADGFVCSGRIPDLNLESRPEDADLIAASLKA